LQPFTYRVERKYPFRDEHRNWPNQAAKPVQPMDTEKITGYAVNGSEDTRQRFLGMLKLYSPEMHASVLGSPAHNATLSTPKGTAHLSNGDVADMIKSKNFEYGNKDHASIYGFFIPEEKKQRRRFVLHPKRHNDKFRQHYTSQVKGIIDACKTYGMKHWRQYDLKSSFYQVSLPERTRDYYTFYIPGRPRNSPTAYLRATRVPMGVTYACDLLESILAVLVEAAIRKTKQAFNDADIRVHFHVDNIRFLCDTQPIADAVDSAFREICSTCNVTIESEHDKPDKETRETFLGIRFNYDTGFVCLSSRMLEKISEAFAAIDQSKEPTVRDLLVLAGRLLNANTIQRTSVAPFFAALEYARFNQRYPMEEPILGWSQIRKEFSKWVAHVKQNTPVCHDQPPLTEKGWTLFTDASTKGLGAVLCAPSGEVYVHTENWSSEKHTSKEINQLELRALNTALEHFQQGGLHFDSLVIMMDNTSSLKTALKGHSHAAALNSETERFSSLVDPSTVSLFYIASDKNPGDEPSRGNDYDHKKLEEALHFSKMAQQDGGGRPSWLTRVRRHDSVLPLCNRSAP
jgi:hypothetical protein